MSESIKILIVEDSPLASKLLEFILQRDPQLKVIGSVTSGEEALAFLRTKRPDVITMDIVLPGMDGFEATKRIQHSVSPPIPIVIVSANYQPEDIEKSFKAIVAGAVDIIEKPVGPRDLRFPVMAATLIQAIKNADSIMQLRRQVLPSLQTNKLEISDFDAIPLSKFRAVAMGASLGGPKAVNSILSKLPAHFPAPIFLVQHISPGFAQGYAHWLGESSSLKIKIAEHREIAEPGIVYVASDQCHLEVGPDHTIGLSTAPPEGGLRPSVSRLFRSMAEQYGNEGIGIILTGMGSDGAEDLLKMKQCGALTIAQDQNSCLVFGMPREAIALGAVEYVLSLQQIIDLLCAMAERKKEGV